MGYIDDSSRPRAVTWAFWLWVVATAVGLVGAVLLFSTAPPLGLLVGPTSDRDRVAAIGVLLVGWSLTRLVFAWFMLRGHDWARALLTTLAGLGLAVIIFHFEHVNLLNCTAAAMNASAIVVQYSPSSNAYFSRCYHRAHAPREAPAASAERPTNAALDEAPATDSARSDTAGGRGSQLSLPKRES